MEMKEFVVRSTPMSLWTRDTSSSDADGAPGEHHLVMCAQQGDQAAFEALYERYNTRIYRYLSRMVGDDGVGSELMQETFLKVWEGLPKLRSPSSFTGWLYRIATNCAYTYQYRAKHIQLVPWDTQLREYEQERLSIAGPEQQVEDAELLKLALARVSPTYRPCLILYFVEELPQRQIADLLKMKESCVSKYVSRGKEELRQIYHRLTKETSVLKKRERLDR
jgi:RNA polymerase sigma-70 factor, ECF subfamily